MNDDEIQLQVDEGVAIMVFANPRKLNALTDRHYARMRELLSRVRADASIRALLITGRGKAFSAGADLDYLGSAGTGGRSTGEVVADLMWSACNPLVLEIQELPVPVLTALNGVAAGAGVGIALAGDLVIAARSAYFYLPFAPRLGILPDLGSTWFLPRLAGRARSLGMAMLGDKIAADQALQWGLIWACVEDAALPAESMALARRLAQLPRGMAAELRAAWWHAEANGLAAQLDYERKRQSQLLDGPAFAAGVSAFQAARNR
jgi:2-(1,2-epoxy-1,2-dihydrophenyl)acetyl-CoA isomerase